MASDLQDEYEEWGERWLELTCRQIADNQQDSQQVYETLYKGAEKIVALRAENAELHRGLARVTAERDVASKRADKADAAIADARRLAEAMITIDPTPDHQPDEEEALALGILEALGQPDVTVEALGRLCADDEREDGAPMVGRPASALTKAMDAAKQQTEARGQVLDVRHRPVSAGEGDDAG